MRNSAVRAIVTKVPATRAQLISRSDVFNPTARAASVAQRRKVIVEEIRAIAIPGVSIDMAIKALELRYKTRRLHPAVMDALAQSIKGGRDFISRSVLQSWVLMDKDGGKVALAPKHKGRVRVEGGWEVMAVEIYNAPSKPSMAAVHRDLRRKWAFDCTYEQVKNYLDALPAQLGANSAARLGKDLHKQQQRSFVQRHTRNLNAGSIYMADGYRADVYLAHPVTGKTWRAEIMHVIDLRSRYLVGYRIMAHEGGYDIMMGWAEIFERWGHVPPIIYIDNGSGYKNRLTELEDTSYYRRAGVQAVIHSIPRNPKGKGHIERYHRIVRDDFLKTWKPAFYCGPDMSQEVLGKTARDIDSCKVIPPSLAQFVDAYNDWLAHDYHQRAHPEDKRVTRAQEWTALDPIAPHASAAEMARPCERRKVQRAAVLLHNRRYLHADLHAWNGMEVLVEYDILNHHSVTIRNDKGQLICDAPLVQTMGVVSDSFLADKEQKALKDKLGRLEKKTLEAKARTQPVIDMDAVADGAMRALEGDWQLIEDTGSRPPPLVLDLTFDSYPTH